MKTLYIECNMGAAGDMLMAALYELLEDKEGFLRTMNHLIPGVGVEAVPAATCGIAGTRMEVTVHGHEEESHDLPRRRSTNAPTTTSIPMTTTITMLMTTSMSMSTGMTTLMSTTTGTNTTIITTPPRRTSTAF